MTVDNEENAIVRFNKIVLGWDYLRLLKASKKGAPLDLPQAKDKYSDVDDYLSTFEPLLFEEVIAQIAQRKDEEEVSTWKSGFVSKYIETDGFHLTEVRCIVPETEQVSISQSDLLLLSKEKFQEGTELPKTYAFALVEQLQKLEEGKQMHDVYLLRLRMYLVGEVKQVRKDVAEPSPRLLNMRSLITSSNESDRYLHILKICGLSTIVREYVALRSINTLPFKDLILKGAGSSSSDEEAWKISKPLEEYIEDKLNKSQRSAVNAGLSRKEFVLIQGPPGTGKTQTILGLLSAILHATPARVGLKAGSRGVKRGLELSILEKCNQWTLASPWVTDINPRDKIMPTDGDGGFFPTTGNEFKPEVVNSSRKYRTRVLVCAPSNSALDEIVLRLLSTGVRDESNHAYNPKIVRVGLKPHHSVRAVSMDDLVKQKLAVHTAADKQKHGAGGRDPDSIRASLLDEAAVVFSTLSFSGSSLFTKLNRGFDVVIIDEAAQAVEPATLIPLANGCKQVFLVGDPVQLPATVISDNAKKYGYCTSLFERLQKAGYPVVMLKTQYRMHPEIRSFPSEEFYAGELEDGNDMKEKTERDWHDYRCFGPFCFFDIPGKESDASGRGSWVNVDEVEFVLLMYHELVARYPVLKSSSQIAIICPYRHQLKLFKKRFKEKFGEESEKFVDINTVDGFQGQEKDVAIFSCVRSNKKKGKDAIGFMRDFRRMNVGITRARASVLVVGSASTLKQDEHWKNLVESAEQRNSLFKVPKPYESFFSNENLKTMERTKENQGEQNMDEPGPASGNPDDVVPTEPLQEPDDDPEFGDGEVDAGYDED